MSNIIYSRQQIVTGSTSIAGMTSQGTRSANFTATANSIYEITASCRMTLPSNPSTGDRVAFILTSSAIFEITAPDKIDGKVLSGIFVKQTMLTDVWFVWTYSGSTNGWIWNSIYNLGISEVVWNDPFLESIVLFISGSGQDNSVNIQDSSPTPKQITLYGDTKIRTAQSKYYGSSIFFDGAGDALSVADNLTLATNATIDFWVNVSSTREQDLLCANSGGVGKFEMAIRNNIFSFATPGTSWNGSFGYVFTVGQWYHIAVTMEGTQCKVYVNGILQLTTTYSNKILGTGYFIGRSFEGFRPFHGYMSPIRITNGEIRYTTNFNPEDTFFV